jgi:hypothetical protein
MEADWEFEVAADAPVIDAAWSGLVDLRQDPKRAAELPEVRALPELAEILRRLNDSASPVWTAKCDVWDPGVVDADELDAARELAQHALACYIDLLPAGGQAWSEPEDAAAWCRGVCDRLHARPQRQCRVDLVVRRAVLAANDESLGITVYVTGCGATAAEAAEASGSALRGFADALQARPHVAADELKLQ